MLQELTDLRSRRAFVTIADFDETAGKQTTSKLSGYWIAIVRTVFLPHTNMKCSKAQFVKCDVRNWDDQVSVFEAAIRNSPCQTCDIVIANAGIVGADDLYDLQGETMLTFYVQLPSNHEAFAVIY